MIWSDSGLIFFLFSLASVIALSVNVEEINRSPPLKCVESFCGHLEVSHRGWDAELEAHLTLNARLYMGKKEQRKRRLHNTVSQTLC